MAAMLPRLALLLLLAPLAGRAQSIATNAPTGATRVADYTLDAKVDPDRHTLDATETIAWRNLTGQPLATFPFHLYLNAFRPQSTFTHETHFGGGIRDSESDNSYPDEKLGSIEIAHIDADGFGDLTPTIHFTAPDDGNAQDHTVAEITLPRPLAPGDTITFHLAFHDKFPLSIARNGYKRDFLMGGQWYPKPGVFWHGQWNCHQYHATTEFFSDFATFNVSLTLPRRFVLGASGVPTGEHINSNNTVTKSFYAEDVGDFAFALSPHFQITDGTYLSAVGPVQIHVLALAAHPKAGLRYLSVIQRTMQQFEQRYGPYPYKIITVIDPEPGSEIGGMEYPTLITGETSWFEPTLTTEVTAEHEFGHQYWYGMVATNEFEDAWLDEGINSYTEVKVMGALYGRDTSFLNYPWLNFSDAELQRLQYVSATDLDPVTRHAWQFRNATSYGGVTYGKSATLLATLEGIVGTETMDDAMRTWFQRYRFTHPTTEDFLHTIEEAAVRHGKATPLTYTPSAPNAGSIGAYSGTPTPCLSMDEVFRKAQQNVIDSSSHLNQYHVIVEVPPATPPPCPPTSAARAALASFDIAAPTMTVSATTLRPFFNQAVYGTAVLDYAVDDISSDPVQWWLPEPKKPDPKNPAQYLDTVVLRRRGDFILPVTVEIVFEDGTRIREVWDGVDRWHRFTYTRTSKILSAEVDPDHVILLDRNFFNNSITTRPNTLPERKIATLWIAFQQLFAQLSTWFV